ncbi:DUF3612 domain-containing protein [Shewanella avicenniae]|uniref:DUF3612 domain-containing protein n=1 Tax=Shewanella avicenniae TaxID=2814294 RepID=A0ABX7QQT5_9GAMM|nr:DUF3612 domain-containing protein [Shewanella avicenniae]QSX33822.1 DUF3612 domain-containing protein [Shewanella avicenniae]
MRNEISLTRKSHFLGTKIRNLRKRNHLTMEDLSARCVRLDSENAPSVSYLSMIERGKRTPSVDMLRVIAAVFQKELDWFLDDTPSDEAIVPQKGRRGGLDGMVLEPGFLFSGDILQIAIPEMLSQTGTSGRQFAQLLIRAYQEYHQNHFPDLERAAEDIGNKQLALSVEELVRLAEAQGLKIRWFSEAPKTVIDAHGISGQRVITSYLEGPGKLALNEILKTSPTRMKYDLGVHIGHCVLHNSDGYNNVLSIGSASAADAAPIQSGSVNAQDILQAWREFEASFFAGALLCPKVPFRQLLDRQGYEVGVHKLAQVSPSVAMRRMTVVSPYPHWHYFDAYAPGKLKAVYRGNGIPLPWGNMRTVADPCQHWSVFRMITEPKDGSAAQISLLDTENQTRIYCCESVRVRDLAGNNRVLCAGIDLNPAIEAQGEDAAELAASLKQVCVANGGEVDIPAPIKRKLHTISRILNINWLERGLQQQARLICARGAVCPRSPSCYDGCKGGKADD